MKKDNNAQYWYGIAMVLIFLLFFKKEVLAQMNQFIEAKSQTAFDNVIELMRKEIT